MHRDELVTYCNQLLAVSAFSDYAPNGLQIEGRSSVARIVSGVTASLATIESAIEHKADVLLVHHGYFWKREAPQIVGMKQARIKLLLEHDINLLAYHLPLDAHEELGNNSGLGRALEMRNVVATGLDGVDNLFWHGQLARPMGGETFADFIEQKLGRKPLHIPAKSTPIEQIGWCTGGAQGYIEHAASLGLDAYISGEISESTVHMARELGVDYFSAGHHATERYGVQQLGEHLAATFGVTHQFIDQFNPV